ncbi:hypothetical protein [Candidatus Parabeggiatoa sp. HSG14]|uniref:hypothetical protein n=1 Tax=Candidatus Parabeggiatoa sp. HSG14 TaxID=3055593 RepID=UPI0025A88EA2|nr:hypothetical protein [Thiotrichales bacterium HSG14]
MQIKFIFVSFVCLLVGCATTLENPNDSQGDKNSDTRTENPSGKEADEADKEKSSSGKNELLKKLGNLENTLKELESESNGIQTEMNSRTSKVIQNKLDEVKRTLDVLNTDNTLLQKESDALVNLPLIKRIEYLYHELISKREREKLEQTRFVSVDEPIETRSDKAKKKTRKPKTAGGKKRRKTPKKPIAKKSTIPKPIKTPKPKAKSVGKGRIVVVSLSTFSGGQQKTIRNSFFEVLKAKKKKSRSFILYTIQSGKQLRTLLTSSQLRRLPIEGGSSSILGKLETGMQFKAKDLKAFADLSKVIKSKRKKVGRVLYITDNKRIDSVNQKQRDILLKWNKAGGRLIVLTSGSCSVWKQVKAKCRALSNLKGTLKSFM